MMDMAFHITPLVTAVGKELVNLVSSRLSDHIRGIIGMTIFHLSFSNHTGMALFDDQTPFDEKKFSFHCESYHTTVILLCSLLLIDADLYSVQFFMFSFQFLHDVANRFPLAAMKITFSFFNILLST